MNSEKDLKLKIIKDLIGKYNPYQIILFGSRARHTEKKLSDYDTLAVFDRELSKREKLYLENNIRKELAKHFIDVHIIVISLKEAELYKKRDWKSY